MASEQPFGGALVRALESATLEVDWVRSNQELRSRAARPDLPAPAVVFVVPSLRGATDLGALADLAFRSLDGSGKAAPENESYLEAAVASYAANRILSVRQQRILTLYLQGKGDKEIAELCSCSETTVYEHWRRIARKAGGLHKSEAIADFHRFLSDQRHRQDGRG